MRPVASRCVSSEAVDHRRHARIHHGCQLGDRNRSSLGKSVRKYCKMQQSAHQNQEDQRAWWNVGKEINVRM
jgi:hypothetical protein